jgi:hypothetical protein
MIEYYTAQLNTLQIVAKQYKLLERDYLYCNWCRVFVYNGWNIILKRVTTERLAEIKLVCRCGKELIDFTHQKKWRGEQFYESFYVRSSEQVPTPEPKPEPKDLIPCPECPGFVEKGICSLCNNVICGKCQEKFVEGHECKNEDIKNVNSIKKDTKRCPSCRVPIHKISGCSQMWCTNCHTTFDYKTGEIIRKTVIHNPHYFNYVREHPQNMNQMGMDVCMDLRPRDLTELALDLMRSMRHVREVSIRSERSKLVTAETIRDKSLQYLLNKISKKEWLEFIKRSIKRNMLCNSKIQIYEMYVFAATNLLINKCQDKEILKFSSVMKDYITEEMKKYGSKVQCVTLIPFL